MSIETPDPAFQADALHKVNNASFDNGESFASLCAQIYAKVHTFLDSHASSHLLEQVQEQTRLSLRIIDEALARFGYVIHRMALLLIVVPDAYSPTEISFSYNGGKDCLVLLILYLVSLQSRHKKNGTPLGENLPAVYIVSSYPFEEVENFVATSSQTYHLDLLRYPIPMRQAFDDYIKANTEIKAILVGTRRTDPHGSNLRYFDPTDRGWPSFMRVHPVIDWHYAEIWAVCRRQEHIQYYAECGSSS